MKIPEGIATHNIAEFVQHPGGETVLARIPESLRVCLNDNASNAH